MSFLHLEKAEHLAEYRYRFFWFVWGYRWIWIIGRILIDKETLFFWFVFLLVYFLLKFLLLLPAWCGIKLWLLVLNRLLGYNPGLKIWFIQNSLMGNFRPDRLLVSLGLDRLMVDLRLDRLVANLLLKGYLILNRPLGLLQLRLY